MNGKISKALAIQKVLGRPGQSLADFRKEYVELSDADRLELAQGCARELYLSQAEADFPLEAAVAPAV
jgi:hypothetical protein